MNEPLETHRRFGQARALNLSDCEQCPLRGVHTYSLLAGLRLSQRLPTLYCQPPREGGTEGQLLWTNPIW